MPTETKCKKCKYYKKIDENKGYCLRYPPNRTPYICRGDSLVVAKHIVVNNTDYCGEFVATV